MLIPQIKMSFIPALNICANPKSALHSRSQSALIMSASAFGLDDSEDGKDYCPGQISISRSSVMCVLLAVRILMPIGVIL